MDRTIRLALTRLVGDDLRRTPRRSRRATRSRGATANGSAPRLRATPDRRRLSSVHRSKRVAPCSACGRGSERTRCRRLCDTRVSRRMGCAPRREPNDVYFNSFAPQLGAIVDASHGRPDLRAELAPSTNTSPRSLTLTGEAMDRHPAHAHRRRRADEPVIRRLHSAVRLPLAALVVTNALEPWNRSATW
jgi:hypothetical protein